MMGKQSDNKKNNYPAMKILKCTLGILLIICLGFSAANAQSARKLTKKGAELEVGGMPEEAAEYYYRALVKNKDYVDALIGLNRTAPLLMDRKLLQFSSSYNNQDYQEAYDKYVDASAFRSNLANVGVQIDIAKPYSDKYYECCSILAEQYYSSGKGKLDNGDFVEAIADLKTCLEFKSPYKDADALIDQALEAKTVSDAERFYQSGMNKLESQDYRGAYYDFGKCLSYKNPFKDAVDMQAEALKKGKVRIGIFEFSNDTKASGANGALYSYVVTYAVNYESPFIEIVDRDNLQRLLEEQKLGMSGVVDESTASEAGKVLGLNYVVLGRLINVTQTGGDVSAQKVNVYELYPTKNSEGVQIMRGKPVTYTRYEGSKTLTFEAAYQVISVETSEIVHSDIVSSNESDQVRYATYNGDPKKLCTINPDNSYYSQSAINNNMVDQRQFSARQKFKSQEEMQPNIIKSLATKIANGICGQFK
jgi:tetratricopeptide (TPR) repeat protein